MADDISRESRDRIEIEAEKERIENVEHIASPQQDGTPRMDPARRIVVEKSLKRKLDARCSLFVAIYSEYSSLPAKPLQPPWASYTSTSHH